MKGTWGCLCVLGWELSGEWVWCGYMGERFYPGAGVAYCEQQL